MLVGMCEVMQLLGKTFLQVLKKLNIVTLCLSYYSLVYLRKVEIDIPQNDIYDFFVAT